VHGLASLQSAGMQGFGGSVLVVVVGGLVARLDELVVELVVELLDELVVELLVEVLVEVLVVVCVVELLVLVLVEVLLVVGGRVEVVERVVEVLVDVLDVVDRVLVVEEVAVVVVVEQGLTGVWTQVWPATSQVSVVHGSPSSQLRGVPSRQMPPRQASFNVQKEPSSHGVVSGLAGCVQARPAQTSSVHGLPSSVHEPARGVKTQPLVGLQVSMVHSLPSLQMSGLPGWQVAAASQTSPTVHGLLSLHGVPGAGVCP